MRAVSCKDVDLLVRRRAKSTNMALAAWRLADRCRSRVVSSCFGLVTAARHLLLALFPILDKVRGPNCSDSDCAISMARSDVAGHIESCTHRQHVYYEQGRPALWKACQ